MTNQETINAHQAAIKLVGDKMFYTQQINFLSNMKVRAKSQIEKANIASKMLEVNRYLKRIERSYDNTIKQLTKTK